MHTEAINVFVRSTLQIELRRSYLHLQCTYASFGFEETKRNDSLLPTRRLKRKRWSRSGMGRGPQARL